MRQFTLNQYKGMAIRFNKMSFYDKIKTIMENKDILTLASDHNWWAVKVKDKDIQEILFDTGNDFKIENEWDAKEIMVLVDLLGIKNVDI